MTYLIMFLGSGIGAALRHGSISSWRGCSHSVFASVVLAIGGLFAGLASRAMSSGDAMRDQRAIGARPSLSISARSRSRSGLGVVRSFGP